MNVSDLLEAIDASMSDDALLETVHFIQNFRPIAVAVAERTLMGGFLTQADDIHQLLMAAAAGGADAYRDAIKAVAPDLLVQIDAMVIVQNQ